MILIYTYIENGVRYLDYGINTNDDSFVILPNEPIDCQRMNIHWSPDYGYYTLDKCVKIS